MSVCVRVCVEVAATYVRACAGIMCDSGAASISDCHVLVEPGITNPKAKDHSAHSKDEEDSVRSAHMYVPEGKTHIHIFYSNLVHVYSSTHTYRSVL